MSRQGKPRKRTSGNIKNFWETEAKIWGHSPQVTIRDFFFRNHELNTLLSVIPKVSKLLDVGCGNGFGTLVLSQKAEYTLGLDYSKAMIRWATKAKNDEAYRLSKIKKIMLDQYLSTNSFDNVNFAVADVSNLDLSQNKFDVITGQRILINLPTSGLQMKTLKNLRNYIQSDGLLILVEATTQGHQITDAYRQKQGLPILEKYWHNNYIDENYQKWTTYGWKVTQILSFDTYALLSKIIYPAACGEKNCTFLSEANQAASEIANIFRTKKAVDEIGTDNLLKIYADRVSRYNSADGKLITKWITNNKKKLADWSGLGHQKLIIAKPI
jgi:SAM-dependent methyltransferase